MTDHQAFLVRPLEPVYFGPPATFAAGDVLTGHTQFPPSPWAFQGLVRTRLLAGAEPALDLADRSSAARRRIAELVGEPDALPEGWRLRGPLPVEWIDGVHRPWLPAPRHLLRDDNGRLALARRVEPAHPGCSDLAPEGEKLMVGLPQSPAARARGGWLSAGDMWTVLSGQAPEGRETAQGAELPPCVCFERRVGLAIDREELRARPGLIYTRSSLRFAFRCGLIGWLTGELKTPLRSTALTSGTQSAGRGGRQAAFEPVEALDPTWHRLAAGEHLPAAPPDGFELWLIALGPVRVTDGSVRHPEIHADLPPGVRLELVAALAGRHLVIGGYSIARRASRDNYVYAPAGSAWLGRLSGGSPEQRGEALRRLHDANPLGPRDEAPFGFGHCWVGLADPQEGGSGDE